MNDDIKNCPAGTTPLATEGLSEADILKREAEQAKTAMADALTGLQQSLRTAGDIRLWAQHHPWLTVGASAAAGFAAGSAITTAVQGGGTNGQAPQEVIRTVEKPTEQRSSPLWASLMAPFFDMAKVALQSAIASAMGGAMQVKAQHEATEQAAEESVHAQPDGVPRYPR